MTGSPRRPAEVDEDRLRAIVADQIRAALGHDADQLSSRRADSLERYEGEPYGDERPGRSQVMSRDVMETVEAVMPSLVRAFLGTEEVVRYEPEGPEDEAYAAQATDYVNLVLMRDNPGFRIAVDWMKSALISATSVVKLWWDETDTVRTESYRQLGEDELVALVAEDGVEVVEHTPQVMVDGAALTPDAALALAVLGAATHMVHDVRIRRTRKRARLRWEAVPPEEFLINRRARSLDEEDSTFTFCCHRQARTIEELEHEGYDAEILSRANDRDDDVLDEARERLDGLDQGVALATETAPGQRRVWVYECYLKADMDGDGISELRRVTVLGGASNTEILDNEAIEELPFAELCPIRLPHRFYGWSLADLTKDIQRLKTALWRGMMDGLYLSLYPHKAVDENRVDLDDLLSEDPGSIYRVNGDPASAIVPIATQWNGAQAFPMMEYIDRVLASRSGVNDLAGGLDGGALQGETARAVDEAAHAARARVELIARTFAETGWTRLMRLALKMLNRYQDRVRVAQLRGGWMPVDPRSWNTDMDVRITVALGVGTKAEQIQKYGFIAAKQEAVLAQMGPANPLAPLDKYYNTLKKLAEAADLQPSAHFDDPAAWVASSRQAPPPPNPALTMAEAELALRREEAELKAATERYKADLDRETDAAKLALEAEKLAREHGWRAAALRHGPDGPAQGEVPQSTSS